MKVVVESNLGDPEVGRYWTWEDAEKAFDLRCFVG